MRKMNSILVQVPARNALYIVLDANKGMENAEYAIKDTEEIQSQIIVGRNALKMSTIQIKAPARHVRSTVPSVKERVESVRSVRVATRWIRRLRIAGRFARGVINSEGTNLLVKHVHNSV